MTISLVVLILASIALDVGGQLFFKYGMNTLSDRSLARAIVVPWLWAGVATYAVELVIWLWVLAHVRLTIAFPCASLSYCGVVVGSRLFLGESVPRQRWIAVALITVGVVLVGATANA
jgi:undecaprenyl phosphate-alpha-L-ara4N flippase subunit ArnE